MDELAEGRGVCVDDEHDHSSFHLGGYGKGLDKETLSIRKEKDCKQKRVCTRKRWKLRMRWS